MNHFSKDVQLLEEHDQTQAKIDRLLAQAGAGGGLDTEALYSSLSSQFELGWALLYSDGRGTTIAEVQDAALSVDWSNFSLSDLDHDSFVVTSPKFTAKDDHFTLIFDTVIRTKIPRNYFIPLAVLSGYPTHPSLWLKVLADDGEMGILVVAGFTMKPPDAVAPTRVPRPRGSTEAGD